MPRMIGMTYGLLRYNLIYSSSFAHTAPYVWPTGDSHTSTLQGETSGHGVPVAGRQAWTSKLFRPLHLGIGVAKENTTQSTVGWNTLLTQTRGVAGAASAMGVCSHGPRVPPGSRCRAVARPRLSRAETGGPCPLTPRGRIQKWGWPGAA